MVAIATAVVCFKPNIETNNSLSFFPFFITWKRFCFVIFVYSVWVMVVICTEISIHTPHSICKWIKSAKPSDNQMLTSTPFFHLNFHNILSIRKNIIRQKLFKKFFIWLKSETKKGCTSQKFLETLSNNKPNVERMRVNNWFPVKCFQIE